MIVFKSMHDKQLSIKIGNISERKKPVIMVGLDNIDFVIGYMRNDKCMCALISAIEYIAGNNDAGDDLRNLLMDWRDTL